MSENPEHADPHPDLLKLQGLDTDTHFDERALAGLELVLAGEVLVNLDTVQPGDTLQVRVFEGEGEGEEEGRTISFLKTGRRWRLLEQSEDGTPRERSAIIDGSGLPLSSFLRHGVVVLGAGLSYIAGDTILVDSGADIPEGEAAEWAYALPPITTVEEDIIEYNLNIGTIKRDTDGNYKWSIWLRQERVKTGPIIDAKVIPPEQP